MRRAPRTLLMVVIVLLMLPLLAACQQSSKAVDYGPQLSAIASSAGAAADTADQALQLTQGLSSDLDVLTASVAGLRTDVQTLSAQAQALADLPAQLASLSDVVRRVDPTTSALVGISFPTGLQLTVSPGACPADLPPASTARKYDEVASIVRLGLPPGPVCIASADPPAGLTVQAAAGQLVSVLFHVPDDPD